jgi:hypothetical protein
MQPEIVKRPSGKKVILLILITLISLFIIYFTVMMMISPIQKLKSMNSDFSSKPAETGVSDNRFSSDSSYLRLLRERVFLQSRIVMAEADSIYLTINLSDSTANIEISGVPVHRAKFSSIHASKILMKGNESTILSLLATPFTISKDYSTIKKEPVMIKMAPKDTSEYKPNIMPDTSITEPVNYILEMTNGTRIYIYQEEGAKFSDRSNVFIFDLNDRLRNTLRCLKSIMSFKVPEYHPFIKLKLPRADAKIIYRALPKYGQIGIYR